VFWSPRFSTQLAGAFINPAAFLRPQDMDLQTLGTNFYSATARYHFVSSSRFAPFAGAGAALASFRNLDERFGESYELEVEATPALVIEGGVRFRFQPRIHFDFTVTYMPVEADVNVIRNTNNLPVPDTLALNPLTMKAGATWRF
jgi:outer membrane protein W